MEITFTKPIYLFLLSAVPLLIVIHFFSLQYAKMRAIRLANFEALKRALSGQKIGRHLISKNLTILMIRCFTIIFLVLSAAGPVLWYSTQSGNQNYVLALDASGSMLADDIKPTRLEAAKQSAILFASKLEEKTEIGVVSFSGMSYVDQRLTKDYLEISTAIEDITIKSTHGTAIGDALKTSANLILAKEKPGVIILLTDGRENVASADEIDKVIEYLNKEHITVNAIGIGTKSGGSIPGLDVMSSIDESALEQIASKTGGQYFRAEDEFTLRNAYESIVKESSSKEPFELGVIFILLAIGSLFNEWGLLSTKFRTVP